MPCSRACVKTLTRLLLGLCCLTGMGCLSRKEAPPQIVPGPTGPDVQALPPVRSAPTTMPGRGAMAAVPRDWTPPAGVEKRWRAIVIHHSATGNGNMAIFDRTHREENKWQGVGYDFVIGNGTDSADGQVEVTFRWHQQIVGAHCRTPGNWANENAVGICLVGNFDHTRPSQRQMSSLAKLVHFLQRRYNIPPTRIYGHGTTPGAGSTGCPGVHFPMDELHALVNRQS